MAHSKQRRPRKQARGRKATRPLPHPDFPLFHHHSGRWAKKLPRRIWPPKGRIFYFGKVDADPLGVAALELWNQQKDDLLAGREPRPSGTGVKIADVVNSYLTHKVRLLESGELSPRTFARYKATGEMLAAHFGRDYPVDRLTPAEFEALRAKMAERWGPIALANEIGYVRQIFIYAYKAEIIDKPARFGPGFDKPSAKTLRKVRTERGPKLFTPDQIHTLLNAASPNMAAMILLGINGGLGNTDVARLPLDALELAGTWLDYPRPKTAIPRRVPLWPETVAAIRKVLAERPEPGYPQHEGLLFIRRDGSDDPLIDRVTREFRTLMARAGVDGRSFYDLRRTFETIGGDSRDQVAVDSIMGHAPDSSDMAAIYRQRVDDGRLQAVVNHVRTWLYGSKPARASGAGSARAGQANKPKPRSGKPAADAEPPRLRIVG
jgi:integrase